MRNGFLTGALCALIGLSMAVPIMAYSASVDNDGFFALIQRFLVIPMTLFAGVFFPISQLPGWVQPIIWLTPVWHGAELARGAAFGTWTFWPSIGHLGYLAALIAVGVVLGRRLFARRLGE